MSENIVGSAFVEIGTVLTGLKSGLAAAKGLTTAFVKTASLTVNPLKQGFMGLGSVVGKSMAVAKAAALLGMAGMAGALAGGIGLVKLAATAEETESKFLTVFGNMAGDANKFATEFGGAVGRSVFQMKTFLAEMQNLFTAMSFSTAESNKLSQTVTRLAVDLASFQNMTDEDSLAALNSGLTGSHETLKKFGVFINDNVLSLKLMQMGLAKNAQEATEQQKVLARLQIVLESTRSAQGDASKTSGSLSNSWRGLTGAVMDLGIKLGQTLMPAAMSVISAFSGLAQWVNQNMAMFSRFGEIASESISGLIQYFAPVYEWLGQLAVSAFEFGTHGKESFDAIGAAIGSILPSFATVKEWVNALVFTFLTWDLTVKRVGLNIADTMLNSWEATKNFATNSAIVIVNFASNAWAGLQNFGSNAVTLFQWIGSNWLDILFTSIDYVMTGFINLGKNIRTIFFAVIDSIRKGSIKPLTDAFKDGLVSITEGAQSSIKAMPKFKDMTAGMGDLTAGTTAFKPIDFSDQFADLDKQVQSAADSWFDIMKKNGPKIGEAAGTGIKDGLKDKFDDSMGNINLKDFKLKQEQHKGGSGDKGDSGEKIGLTAAFDKLQKAALNKSLDPQKQMLAVARQSDNKLASIDAALKPKTKAEKDKAKADMKKLMPLNPYRQRLADKAAGKLTPYQQRVADKKDKLSDERVAKKSENINKILLATGVIKPVKPTIDMTAGFDKVKDATVGKSDKMSDEQLKVAKLAAKTLQSIDKAISNSKPSKATFAA